ncbi:MAG: hypothetical protein QNK23_05290 [Crocinitomicaceae bacterium]|nr:hypothetical protein [Crocinitomicaceae bacterium]
MIHSHSFHIPVMGIGYTIDSPLKVSRYGIDSVISLADDILLERLRKMYCGIYKLPYTEITEKTIDFRAERITSYLNLIKELAEKKFEEFKSASIEKKNELKSFIGSLPNGSKIKEEFNAISSEYFDLNKLKDWVQNNLSMGSIDVNIMTKLDKENYSKNEKLPIEFNDAHAAMRGYAKSKLSSSIILSAGMNPRLYSYIEQFEDFYASKSGSIKKKIVLKVSDYRSALIQGRFLAKKGLWVSEYRIESGLNCGGHAFATDGFLLGPILAEFRDKKNELIDTVFETLVNALKAKDRSIPSTQLPLKITAQGGIGTSEEHDFLLDHYQLDSVGWGSPFLLVPEATSIDKDTIDKLAEAKEKDLYLSGISPLGVPFNNLRGNTKDFERDAFIAKDRPGAPCTKAYLSLNKEFTEKAICPGSRQYTNLKLKELDALNLPEEAHKKKYGKIVEKTCICVGLGTSTLLANNLDTKVENDGVSVCPGPNMAYFSKVTSLKEMTDHIYGRTNIISRTDRPFFFVKELTIYVDYLKQLIEDSKGGASTKEGKYIQTFIANLLSGVDYYETLFRENVDYFKSSRKLILENLETTKNELQELQIGRIN